MSTRIASVALTAILIYASLGYGQELTEKYIPVGAYPELAGKYTIVGKIVSVEEQMGAFTMRRDSSIQRFEVTDTTKIWLDKSMLKETNVDGKFSDLRTGLVVEVGVVGPGRMHIAKWVKVQISTSQ